MKPRILDLFCGAGGSAMGLYRAGFEVEGVDIKPQPHYPFRFHLADALEFPLEGYDAYWASPPCQFYSRTRFAWPERRHPDLLSATRDHLQATGKPWVIENVVGAPFQWYITLCGVMFDLKTYRHRRFEMNWLCFQPAHRPHPERLSRKGRGPSAGGYSNPCGHQNVRGEAKVWAASLGIDWMSPRELTQAIPPAYAEFLGRQLMATLKPEIEKQEE